jgi:hypothetical protein
MLTRTSTPATNMSRIFAVALGVLLCGSAHAAFAAGSGAADALPSDAPLYDYFRAARGYGPDLAWRKVNLNQTPRPAENLLHLSFEGAARQPAVLARLHQALGSDLGLSSGRASPGDPEVALRNADAVVRAKAGLTLSKKWLGFVYADMGAVDSALRWQGLAVIRSGKGFDVFGGWRRVTYHFSPGMGFDSLDFNGPVLGATFAW